MCQYANYTAGWRTCVCEHLCCYRLKSPPVPFPLNVGWFLCRHGDCCFCDWRAVLCGNLSSSLLFIISRLDRTSSSCTEEENKHILITSCMFCMDEDYYDQKHPGLSVKYSNNIYSSKTEQVWWCHMCHDDITCDSFHVSWLWVFSISSERLMFLMFRWVFCSFMTVNWIYLGCGLLVGTKQDIWRPHLGFWETVINILKKQNIFWHFTDQTINQGNIYQINQ